MTGRRCARCFHAGQPTRRSSRGTASEGCGSAAISAATARARSAYDGSSSRRGTSAPRAATSRGPSVDRDAGADGGDVAAVDELVEGEERHHDLGHARGERAHGGAEAAVPDHRRGVGEHSRLGPPLLHVGVGRATARASSGSKPSPHGHQHPRVEVGQGVQRLAEDAVEGAQRAGDRAEGHVDQRRSGSHQGRSSAPPPAWARGSREVAVGGGLPLRRRRLGDGAEQGLGRQRRAGRPSASPASRPSSATCSASRSANRSATRACRCRRAHVARPPARPPRARPARRTRAARGRVASLDRRGEAGQSGLRVDAGEDLAEDRWSASSNGMAGSRAITGPISSGGASAKARARSPRGPAPRRTTPARRPARRARRRAGPGER